MAGKGKPGRRIGHREQGAHQCRACAHPELARLDFLCASGAHQTAVAAQFGLTKSCVHLHFRRHVSDRYKRIVGANRLETFEQLLTKAADGGAETLDILDLLVRGHSQMWSVALDSGSATRMVQHANKILAATELRAKITRELVPGPTLQVNNYLLHDAAQIVNVLHEHPDAAEALLQWHQKRSNTRAIEHAVAAD
jgi:hypothetical protein